jgi:hypothetical protein
MAAQTISKWRCECQMRLLAAMQRCLVWVNNGPDGPETRLLLYPDQRTSSDRPGTSEKCQHATLKMHPAQKKSRPKAALNFSPNY